jgi:ELP3 family radical SAM enzyme/protein acetyltransferase
MSDFTKGDFTKEDFTKEDFVIEFYNEFHTNLSKKPIKFFDEIQEIYQHVFQKLLSKHKLKKLFTNIPKKSELYEMYEKLVEKGILPFSHIIERVLVTKLVRSSSGVLPISIALDGRKGGCDYDCSMCPNECVKEGAPQDIARSYLSSEGTFIRGKIQDFSIVEQTWRRIAELENMGHPPDKFEFIILGGTFDCFPREYRCQISMDIFYACNMYQLISNSELLQKWYSTNPFATNAPLSTQITEFLYNYRSRPIFSEKTFTDLLKNEQAINTKSTFCRVIGIVFETRPDRVNRYSMTDIRMFGCTRLQIGIQSCDDGVLTYNNRGHKVIHSIKANKYARDNGFKFDGHIMPDLPGTTIDIDYKTVREVFLGYSLQLDYCKIYPSLDLPYTKIREWKKTGKWKPIAENNFPVFLEFLAYTMMIVPPWTRINRVQRDFPESSLRNNGLGYVSDTIKTNLQQIVTQYMESRNMKCYDIRTREIRNAIIDTQLQFAKLYIRVYRANEGTEFFISVEIPNSETDFNDTLLLGLCRLRIPDFEFADKKNEGIPSHYLPVYRNKKDRIARIRELHVYGNIASINSDGNSQHRGVGIFLMSVAERISQFYQCTLVSVISGVGVREYYSRIGYNNVDQFMVKNIDDNCTPLFLFNKLYDIKNSIENSIISRKYILNKNDPVNTNTFIYKDIQNGEAEGFVFNGTEISEKKVIKKSFSLFYIFLLVLLYIL